MDDNGKFEWFMAMASQSNTLFDMHGPHSNQIGTLSFYDSKM